MVGRAVRLARTVRMMSRKDLALQAGISYPYLSEIENDKKAPSPRTLNALSEALGVKPHELMETADRLQTQEHAEGALSYMTVSRLEANRASPSWFRDEPSRENKREPTSVNEELLRALEELSDADLDIVEQLVERLRTKS